MKRLKPIIESLYGIQVLNHEFQHLDSELRLGLWELER